MVGVSAHAGLRWGIMGRVSDKNAGPLTRGEVEGVIAYALGDALLLRQEMQKHDISPQLRHDLMAAAMPAFIALEAGQARAEKRKREQGSEHT